MIHPVQFLGKSPGKFPSHSFCHHCFTLALRGNVEASCLQSSLSAVAEQPLGHPPAPVPTSRALWTGESRADTLPPLPLLSGWRGSRGAQQPLGVLDSPGDASFHLPFSLLPRLQGVQVSWPASFLAVTLAWRGFGPSSDRVGLAPAACPLANSDYFSFSVLSWVPLFLTVHFLWTQD